MYSPEQREKIYKAVCDGIASGLALRKVCATDPFGGEPKMPSAEAIRVWLLNDAEFYAQYTRAREARADARSDFIDEVTEKVLTGEYDANAARVAIDAQKWQAGKENSKRYGDKLQVDADLSVRLPDDALGSRLAFLAGKAGVNLASRGGGEAE